MQEGFPDPEFTLSPELNERAVALVLNSVVKYPQAGESAAILSNRLMDDFNPTPMNVTGVGIREIIRVQPDPDEVAARINRIHERFGIARQVMPGEADHIVRATAIMAVDNIRWTLRRAGRAYRPNPVPVDLLEMSLYVESADGTPTNPAQSLPAAADALHYFLMANPTLRVHTANDIRVYDNIFRHKGKNWRDDIQIAHSRGIPLRNPTRPAGS